MVHGLERGGAPEILRRRITSGRGIMQTSMQKFLAEAAVTPVEEDVHYFRAWQQVAVALQKRMRADVSANCFRDLDQCEDRDAAFPLVVYAAGRPCYGRPPSDFTFDVADSATLPAACRMIGGSIQFQLGRIESRLRAAGRIELGRRYAPVWHMDVLRTVRNK